MRIGMVFPILLTGQAEPGCTLEAPHSIWIATVRLLCQADITSKNKKKVKRILKNYEGVKEKVQEVEEKDRVRNFEPPISGEDVMEAFDLQPCKMIGDIKNAVKDAVLEGTIRNDRKEAWGYMLRKGRELGLEPVKEEPSEGG